MIIIAGTLHFAPADRDRYVAAVHDIARLARAAPGCLDFVQAADPLDAGRINIYERWESDADVEKFRESGDAPAVPMPQLLSAEVSKYRISAVEAP
ncbi:putative quinol monooxygenase [Actinoplanes sp. DH11]|uniref:putative quinol monooxygenase n=1 Tax=Actinoplanes sp. DH11 TaxID=2857011 RepID=UPI001E393546|nr:antibiotic biosynthesis monooxygenase family protein [Actinoplanes sp. DH11]